MWVMKIKLCDLNLLKFILNCVVNKVFFEEVFFELRCEWCREDLSVEFLDRGSCKCKGFKVKMIFEAMLKFVVRI